VAADDLSAPLGRKTATKRRSLPVAPVTAIAYALALLVAVFLGWALVVRDPFGGEPSASVAVTTDVKPSEAPAAALDKPARPQPDKAAANNASAKPGDGSAVITIIDGSTGQRQEVKIATGDQRLFEATRHGNIPKIASDGTRPADAYARPRDQDAIPTAPRIAIVIGGLGVGAKLTADAVTKLPGPVTLGFSPYGADIAQVAAKARDAGHELLLQVPMEPSDFPDSDPGPQALLTSLAPEQNIDRLHWLMSRFQGYVGLMNFMGARFEATEPAFVPVLKETARRGLIYFDDGTSVRSVAAQAAGSNNAAFAKADVVIDAVPTPTEIDKALAKLESSARANGIAIGFASALPISIERVTNWAKAVGSRGFVLVPISAAATKSKSS
jgi:polysaccharide deacetylase 2 family uncharacterized protein YibQ